MNLEPKPLSEDEKLELLSAVLKKHGADLFRSPGSVPELGDRVRSLLDQTRFVRNTRRKTYSKWLPMAALLLLGINVTLFYNRNPASQNQSSSTRMASLQEELSPFAREGAMYSATPVLTRPGADGQEMLVRVATDPFPKTFKTRKKSIPWEATGLSPLDRGKQIRFYFCKPDETNPSAEAHSWYVLSPHQADRLGRLVAGTPGDLEKARILFRHFCYPEALHYASLACEKDPKNLDSLRLARDCADKLGYKEDSATLSRVIQDLEKA